MSECAEAEASGRMIVGSVRGGWSARFAELVVGVPRRPKRGQWDYFGAPYFGFGANLLGVEGGKW